MVERDVLMRILDLARWAPSGDNTQPWRFEIVADDHIAIHGHDTRDWCVYDFQGRASHMAHGALLETLRIAATGHGLKAQWQIREGTEGLAPIYDVRLTPESSLTSDPLIGCIETRSVQRRPMKTTPLTAAQRRSLIDAPGAGYSVRLFESFAERRKMAGLLWDNAYIRLTCPEAYEVHKKVIHWGARFSDDRIPEEAVGVDPLTARIMQWVMKSWERVDFFNRYLMGTIAPRIQLDVLPALRCAAHVLLKAERPPRTLRDHVEAGVAMQRLWLTAEAQGLRLQPEMTPVIFSWYAAEGAPLSQLSAVNERMDALAVDFSGLVGGDATGVVFMCRLGAADQPRSRSRRLEANELLVRAGTE